MLKHAKEMLNSALEFNLLIHIFAPQNLKQ
jgi:hypothetical protein